MTLDQLRRKLGLPLNISPTFEEMRAHGIEPPKMPDVPPKAPPPPRAKRLRPQ